MLYIQDVELTPNPQALKFILNEKLLEWETRNYDKVEDAQNDPFAKGVFEIPDVVSIFYMNNFVTVEKTKEAGWGGIQKGLISFLQSFDKNLIPAESVKEIDEDDGELLAKVNAILDYKVRPALANDGGGLKVIGIDGKIISIFYQGACGSCPTAITGTLRAIEALLKREVDPNIQVVAAN